MTTIRRSATRTRTADCATGAGQASTSTPEAGQQDRDQVPDHGIAAETETPGGGVSPVGGRSAGGVWRQAAGGDVDVDQEWPPALLRRHRLRGGRAHQHSVRLSEEEQARVVAAARSAGMTVPNLLAETMLASLEGRGQLSVAERHALFGELLAVRRLKALSGNVNQLAAAANSTGQIQPGLTETMRALTRTINRLDAVLDPIEARRWAGRS